MARLIFVDDEPNVLSGLRRMLRPMRDRWEMTFCESGEAALEALRAGGAEVVVSDMKMPKMDGADLLERVREISPSTIRIVLSGQSDEEMAMRAVKPAHQYLPKPCDPDTLKSTVERALALRGLLVDETLLSVVSGMETLPSLPTVYADLTAAIRSSDASAKGVGEIVARDVGMTAKILQLINSAFFGLPRRVSDPGQAVALLGIETVRSLVLSTQIFSEFDAVQCRELGLDRLWVHSAAAGALAKAVAREESGDRSVADDAFLAGLLHDVGKLIIAANLRERHMETVALVRGEGLAHWEAEREVLGCTHAEIGAYLLGVWGLPDAIVQSVAYQHSPAQAHSEGFDAVTAVHVADALEWETTAVNGAVGRGEIDEAHIENLGLTARLPHWRSLAQRNMTAGVNP